MYPKEGLYLKEAGKKTEGSKVTLPGFNCDTQKNNRMKKKGNEKGHIQIVLVNTHPTSAYISYIIQGEMFSFHSFKMGEMSSFNSFKMALCA